MVLILYLVLSIAALTGTEGHIGTAQEFCQNSLKIPRGKNFTDVNSVTNYESWSSFVRFNLKTKWKNTNYESVCGLSKDQWVKDLKNAIDIREQTQRSQPLDTTWPTITTPRITSKARAEDKKNIMNATEMRTKPSKYTLTMLTTKVQEVTVIQEKREGLEASNTDGPLIIEKKTDKQILITIISLIGICLVLFSIVAYLLLKRKRGKATQFELDDVSNMSSTEVSESSRML